MSLSNLHPAKGSRKDRLRVGRGPGSGRQKTSGKGNKGQLAGAGFTRTIGYEGGQMPLHRRLPKRGFTNIFKKEYAVINVGRLCALEGDEFTPALLIKLGIVKKLGDGLKVLGTGDVTRPILVEAHLFSKSALEKIQAAGGSTKVIE
jgi:large subunit ribosomal protein L15